MTSQNLQTSPSPVGTFDHLHFNIGWRGGGGEGQDRTWKLTRKTDLREVDLFFNYFLRTPITVAFHHLQSPKVKFPKIDSQCVSFITVDDQKQCHLTSISPTRAAANCVRTHSLMFGPQIPTRSPFFIPAARNPAANWST